MPRKGKATQSASEATDPEVIRDVVYQFSRDEGDPTVKVIGTKEGTTWFEYTYDIKREYIRIVSEKGRPKPKKSKKSSSASASESRSELDSILKYALNPALYTDLSEAEWMENDEEFSRCWFKWRGTPIHFSKSEHDSAQKVRSPHIEKTALEKLPKVATALRKWEDLRIGLDYSMDRTGGGIYPREVFVAFDTKRVITAWTIEFWNANGWWKRVTALEPPDTGAYDALTDIQVGEAHDGMQPGM